MLEDDTLEHDLDGIRIVLNLPRLGELIAFVATQFAQIRELDSPDYEGQEMRDLAISGWEHVCFMADREQFKQSVSSDLESLSSDRKPQHKPEFGFFEPPV